MADTELEIGSQAEAAGVVLEAVGPIQTTLEELGTTLQGSAGGFKGGAAAGLAEALGAWYEAASELIPTLQAYAGNLVAVDEAEAQTETSVQQRYTRLAGRLGGPQ